MHRIDTDGHVANMFDEGDPGVPRLPTQVDAEILNAFQEEIANAVEASGATLVKNTNTQLRTALALMFLKTGAIPSYGADLTNGLLFCSRVGDGGTDGGGLVRLIIKTNSPGEDSQFWLTINAAWDSSVPNWVKDGTGTSLAIKFRSVGVAGVGNGEISVLHHGVAGGTFNESAWATRGNTLALPLVKREASTAPTLVNNWLDNAGGTYKPIGYYVDPMGRVHLEGGQLSDNAGAATTGTVAFVLPASARPSARVMFRSAQLVAAAVQMTEVTVDANGDVKVAWTGGGVIGSVSLDGISFGT